MTTQTCATTTATNPEVPDLGPCPTSLPDDFAQQLLSRLIPGATPSRHTRATPSTLRAHTALGTPCAKSWDEAWITEVEAGEARLGRRICGAKTIAGPPCELESNHANGRCKFHGGFALTGAAPGNRNGAIHGLYSRRIRPCSDACPMWSRCPCASPQVRALKPVQRPNCPYEQMEYDTALTDALGRANMHNRPDPMHLHIAHNVAALQVMLNRAVVALSQNSLIDPVTTVREPADRAAGYNHLTTKPSAYLIAFTKIAAGSQHCWNPKSRSIPPSPARSPIWRAPPLTPIPIPTSATPCFTQTPRPR